MARFKPEVARRPAPLIVMTYDGWGSIQPCPLTRDYVFMSNTDEPAFPRDHQSDGHNGMSLRDYFAAKAMQAAISQMAEADTDGLTFRERADWAYKQADAMMESRQ
jgi:hypothetical protein